ncbi:hypothetical protein A2U01_0107661, partial [Trifolium medium]|nr:hypothetical protein [Trifolium medium]
QDRTGRSMSVDMQQDEDNWPHGQQRTRVLLVAPVVVGEVVVVVVA